MSGDPDEYASLREKLAASSRRQAKWARRREWIISLVVASLLCVWVYVVIRVLLAL